MQSRGPGGHPGVGCGKGCGILREPRVVEVVKGREEESRLEGGHGVSTSSDSGVEVRLGGAQRASIAGEVHVLESP